MLWRGEKDEEDQRREMASRVEYEAVKAVARRKTRIIKLLVGLNKSISRIRSFE